MRFLINRLVRRKSSKTKNACEDILHQADMIEEGRVSVDQFLTKWKKSKYESNIFQSSSELHYISEAIYFLEQHELSSRDHKAFAKALRRIVFSFGNGVI